MIETIKHVCPPNGPAGLRGETTTDDPERGGASGVQPTEKGTRHPATHRAPLAASSCSHQVQVTYACLQSAYWFCSHLPKCSCKGKCYTGMLRSSSERRLALPSVQVRQSRIFK